MEESSMNIESSPMNVEFWEWLEFTYPKLFGYYKSKPQEFINFYIKQGGLKVNISDYEVDKKYIEENEHLHDLWML